MQTCRHYRSASFEIFGPFQNGPSSQQSWKPSPYRGINYRIDLESRDEVKPSDPQSRYQPYEIGVYVSKIEPIINCSVPGGHVLSIEILL
jgi:hypothetical protein